MQYTILWGIRRKFVTHRSCKEGEIDQAITVGAGLQPACCDIGCFCNASVAASVRQPTFCIWVSPLRGWGHRQDSCATVPLGLCLTLGDCFVLPPRNDRYRKKACRLKPAPRRGLPAKASATKTFFRKLLNVPVTKWGSRVSYRCVTFTTKVILHV